MAPDADPPPGLAIRRLIDGFQVSQAIHVAVVLGVPDLLAQGARPCDDLAAATQSHAPTLYRLLRALAGIGILHEGEQRRFSLTPLGDALRTEVDGSVAGWAAFIGRPGYWQAWSGLLHSVRTGENAFRSVHGTDVWSWRQSRPEESRIFDEAMRAVARRASAALLDAFDFGAFGTVADVGGGNGALLAAILTRHPHLQGILFDQAHVVLAAQPLLERAGVAERCRIEGGSFFTSVPRGADAYVLRSVVHDWDDTQAVQILRTVAQALAGPARMLLVERVIAPPNEGRDAKFSDLNMLVSPGGRERTLDEFVALIEEAGLRLRSVADAGGFSVLEAGR